MFVTFKHLHEHLVLNICKRDSHSAFSTQSNLLGCQHESITDWMLFYFRLTLLHFNSNCIKSFVSFLGKSHHQYVPICNITLLNKLHSLCGRVYVSVWTKNFIISNAGNVIVGITPILLSSIFIYGMFTITISYKKNDFAFWIKKWIKILANFLWNWVWLRFWTILLFHCHFCYNIELNWI